MLGVVSETIHMRARDIWTFILAHRTHIFGLYPQIKVTSHSTMCMSYCILVTY